MYIHMCVCVYIYSPPHSTLLSFMITFVYNPLILLHLNLCLLPSASSAPSTTYSPAHAHQSLTSSLFKKMYLY